MIKKVRLFTLQTFSTTGGIQKMTRTLAHSLNVLAVRNNWNFSLWSAYDKDSDLMPQYLPPDKFEGFGTNRTAFVLKTLISAEKPDVIIISHINLAIIGLLAKALNPRCKLWLIAHGIEVWRPLSFMKRVFLKRCDKIVCVSNFTRQQMMTRHHTDGAVCEVLNNAVDPFIKVPTKFSKPQALLNRHGLSGAAPVVFTLTRLASSEQYKGHDQVIKIIPKLKARFPGITYILAGKYDHQEEIRLQKLITAGRVDKEVILTGFIDEAEIPDYFLLADLFVLPSKKEGFGIVFIEALACGLPVVCGNADGSIDAICNGSLGTAVNTDDLTELERAMTDHLSAPLTQDKRMHLQRECLSRFNANDYVKRLEKMLAE